MHNILSTFLSPRLLSHSDALMGVFASNGMGNINEWVPLLEPIFLAVTRQFTTSPDSEMALHKSHWRPKRGEEIWNIGRREGGGPPMDGRCNHSVLSSTITTIHTHFFCSFQRSFFIVYDRGWRCKLPPTAISHYIIHREGLSHDHDDEEMED